MLEAIGAGVTPRIGDRDWKDIWLESPEYQRARREVADIKAEALKKPPVDKQKLSTCKSVQLSRVFGRPNPGIDASPFFFQLKTVVERNNLALWRSPDYVFTRLFIHAFIALFVSLTLLQLGNSVRDLQYRVRDLINTEV